MNVISTDLKDVYILEPIVHGDHRGWFMESWSQRTLEEHGLHYEFVQDNHSYSAVKGTLRGLHCQKGDAAQAKLVRCIRGRILDVVVDVRQGSPTFKKWISVELSEQNYRQLLIPRGFLHGYVTMTDEAEFLYKTDNFYSKEADRTILWCDSDFGVEWGVDNPIVSEKDAQAPTFALSDLDFKY